LGTSESSLLNVHQSDRFCILI